MTLQASTVACRWTWTASAWFRWARRPPSPSWSAWLCSALVVTSPFSQTSSSKSSASRPPCSTESCSLGRAWRVSSLSDYSFLLLAPRTSSCTMALALFSSLPCWYWSLSSSRPNFNPIGKRFSKRTTQLWRKKFQKEIWRILAMNS